MGLGHAETIVIQLISEFRMKTGEGHAPASADACDHKMIVSGVKIQIFDFKFWFSNGDSVDVFIQ